MTNSRGESISSIGFAKFKCETCNDYKKRQRGCRLDGVQRKSMTEIVIDFDGKPITIDHCPLNYRDETLINDIFYALKIERLGGLDTFFKCSISELAYDTVEFYTMVLEAKDNLIAEIRYWESKE